MKKILISIACMAIFIIGYYFISMKNMQDVTKMDSNLKEDAPVVEKELVISQGEDGFLLNGKKVGEAIYLEEKSNLVVNVKNETEYETSVHFHGVKMSNSMDGVSGVTQDPIMPGESFKYEMYIENSGSYMYHSHVESPDQVQNKFLYGQVIATKKEDVVYQRTESIASTKLNDIQVHGDAAYTFDEVLTNGVVKEKKTVNPDSDIYFSYVNMSSVPLKLDFGKDIKYRIVNVDANAVKSEEYSNNAIIIPAAQRVEFVIKNPNTNFDVKVSSLYEEKIPAIISFNIDDSKNTYTPSEVTTNLYELFETVEPYSADIEDVNIDKTFELDMQGDMWSINDEVFPDTKPIMVNEGDVVELTLINDGHMSEVHPFHLHGHTFKVVELNGDAVEKNLVLDTVEVVPHSSAKIIIKADNPGMWMIHCHDLTHAQKGMMTEFNYEGYYSSASGMVHG